MIKVNNFFKIFFLILTIFQLLLISHRNGFELKLLYNFHKPAYGLLESLKKRHYFTYEIFLLTKKYKILTYNLDKTLIMDETTFQRLIEVTYPARLDNKAKFFFTKDKKYYNKNCKFLDAMENIYLYECI
jgi:hypothetical protein